MKVYRCWSRVCGDCIVLSSGSVSGTSAVQTQKEAASNLKEGNRYPTNVRY